MGKVRKTKARHYESRVRTKAAVIFLFSILICFGMYYYINSLTNAVEEQKENIRKNENILSLTNKLINKVHETQTFANLYSFSGNKKQLRLFRSGIKDIEKINDTISFFLNDESDKKIISDIIILLRQKGKIINQINRQYEAFNPYGEVYELISKYQPVKESPVVITTTVSQEDTVVHKAKRKGFGKRLSEVFFPEETSDSTVVVTKTQTRIDTLEKHAPADTTALLADIQLFTEKGKKEYVQRVKGIEKQYEGLVNSNQKISEEISGMLIQLHRHTLESVLAEIQKSEELIQYNLNMSIYSGSVALLLTLLFIFLIFHDIKEVAKARKATEKAKRQVEEIMESRHKLLLSVSHDIKAPLSSILGYVELMEMEPTTLDNKQKLMSMRHSSQHILALLANLLEYSSLNKGMQKPNISKFNISEICDDLASMFAPIAHNKQLDFIYKRNIEDDFFVLSDSLKIKQILINILSNATKYTVNGGINFSVFFNDDELIFSVIDQGVGIPQDKLEEIYKPFSRIDGNSGMAEGNGFGLYVVKGLIEVLGGKVNVSSKVGQGTHFEIIVPAKPTEPDIASQEENEEKTNSQSLKVLVIDDDNTLLAVISAMLAKLGHASDVCRSMADFSQLASNLKDYDLVLTDREMGTFSGNDMLREIKMRIPDKKVVLMTARSEYNESKARSEGFDGYIQKPLTINALAELLHCRKLKTPAEPPKFKTDFPQLCSMFENDETAVRNILHVFVESTSDNLVLFNDIIESDDFDAATALCHKMKPMFMQLELGEPVAFLVKMDSLRGKGAELFPDWKDEATKFMKWTDDFLDYLSV